MVQYCNPLSWKFFIDLYENHRLFFKKEWPVDVFNVKYFQLYKQEIGPNGVYVFHLIGSASLGFVSGSRIEEWVVEKKKKEEGKGE